jgi:hypothetical protein
VRDAVRAIADQLGSERSVAERSVAERSVAERSVAERSVADQLDAVRLYEAGADG